MTSVLALLAVASLVVGLLLGLPALWTHRPPLLERWLHPVLAAAASSFRFRESHLLEWLLMVSSVAVAAGGWLLARALYGAASGAVAPFGRADALKQRWAAVHRWLHGEAGVHGLVTNQIVAPTLALAQAASRWDAAVFDGLVNGVARVARGVSRAGGWLDRAVVDGLVQGLATTCWAAGRGLRRLHSGRVHHYVAGILVGLLLLVAVASLR
jgi:NADH-quinone oxidoreductase subunit L